MRDRPAYLIVGRGAWAGKMQSILESEQRQVACIAEGRRNDSESEARYTERLSCLIRDSHAQITWLCVPPGPHVPCMMKAAICAGVHVIAEKPWLCSPVQTESLPEEAQRKRIQLGVHFEYCLLDEIEIWRERLQHTDGLRFGGRFTVNRPDRLGIPAVVNLGSHLLAIRRYAVPQSDIAELACAYETPDERRAWIEADGKVADSVDFLQNRQPIIQRFIHRFEAATEGAEFPFGVDFARGVAEDLLRYRVPQTMASRPR